MTSALSVATVRTGLELMARHLRNAPEIDAQRVADWVSIFESRMDDQLFRQAALAATISLTWFPTPGEFAQLTHAHLEERAELAWLAVVRLAERGLPSIVRAEDVMGDPHIVWAMAAIGRPAIECLAHAMQPLNHEERTRATFVRQYQLAARMGLEMREWSDERPPLPAAIPAGRPIPALECDEADEVPL